ncbi:MAG TPA: hypothetical protein VFM70_04730 [Salinimicrobium sp.]|nr:hypothetical protein [Salinimicrobium sp.]
MKKLFLLFLLTIICSCKHSNDNFINAVEDYIKNNPRKEINIREKGIIKTLCPSPYHLYVVRKTDSLYFYITQYQHYYPNMASDIKMIENNPEISQYFNQAIGVDFIADEPVIIFGEDSTVKNLSTSNFSYKIPDKLKFNGNNCHLTTSIMKYGKSLNDREYKFLEEYNATTLSGEL